MKIELAPDLPSARVSCRIRDNGVHTLIFLTYEEVHELKDYIVQLLDTYDKWGD